MTTISIVRERPVTIPAWGQLSIGQVLRASGITAPTGTVNIAWPAANNAIYVPFVVQEPLVIVKAFVETGTQSGSHNIDVGIYTADGTRLVSAGSTAFSASTEQSIDITDTEIGPGTYYMAFACDSTSCNFSAGGTAASLKMAGALEQATAFALPATATFAAISTQTTCPRFGLTARVLL